MPDFCLPPQRIIDLERALLRFLCTSANPVALRTRLSQRFTQFVWRDPEHGVVYEALARIREKDSTSLREQLPVQATRLGFPDIDWALYLTDSGIPERNIEDVARELISNSTGSG